MCCTGKFSVRSAFRVFLPAPIRKHVLGERCLVLEADASAAHVAVVTFPKLCGVTQTKELRAPEVCRAARFSRSGASFWMACV
jgi:hypothetical protein